MSNSSLAPSESILFALALHYRLIGRDALVKKGTKLDDLLQQGVLDDAKLAFLTRKAHGESNRPAPARDFLAMAEELGHLDGATASAIAGTLCAGGPARDYEAASALFNAGALALYQVVDVLEELDRPLQFSVPAQVAYYPAEPSLVVPDATCPTSGRPLVALTNLPGRGLDSLGLPAIDRLVVECLDARAPSPKGGRLVLDLAIHYRLITPDQAELASDVAGLEVQEAVQQLFEVGYLTTTAFRFLLAHAEDTALGGHGFGAEMDTPLFELAMSLGYLSAESLAAFLEDWRVNPSGEVLPEHYDTGVIVQLFNRGFVQCYQAIDLLERRGVALDHSAAGGFQVISRGEEPGSCPITGTPMVRLVGRKTPAELARPLPAIDRLVIPELQPISSAEDVEPAVVFGVAGEESEHDEPSASPRSAIDDPPLVAAVERYHVVAPDRVAEALRFAARTFRPLFDVLRELGYVAKPSAAFLLRRLGTIPDDAPRGLGLLELAAHREYLVVPGPPIARAPIEELALLAEGFNQGRLEFYQFMDVVETRGVWLDHSPKAQVQLYVAPGEADPRTAPALPEALGELVALSRPEARPPGVLPLPTRLQITCLATLSGAADAAARDRDVELDVSGEPLAARIVLRYRLMSPRDLATVLKAWHRAGEELALPQHLFQIGKLTTHALNFLIGKQQQFAGGLVHTGDMHDERLTVIAQTKGYVTTGQLEKLFAQPGAPDAETSDDAELGAFLLARGALTFYQLIDLFEEKGSVLLTTADHERQYLLVGDADPTADYGDPRDRQLLLPLTSAPGFRPRLEPLPELSCVHLERLDARTVPVLRGGRAPAAVSATSPSHPPPSPIPARTKSQKTVAIAKRQEVAQHTAESSRMAMQDFYNLQFPQRELTAKVAAKPPTRRRSVADLVVVRALSVEPTRPTVTVDPAAERLVSQGVHQMVRHALVLAGLLAVGLVVGLSMTHQQGVERRTGVTSINDTLANPRAEATPATLAAKARAKAPVEAYGQLDPRSVNLETKSFFLTIDVGKQVLVVCTGEAAAAELAPLARNAKASGALVVVKVQGQAARRPDGTYILAAGELAVHDGPLPLERLR